MKLLEHVILLLTFFVRGLVVNQLFDYDISQPPMILRQDKRFRFFKTFDISVLDRLARIFEIQA